MANHKPPTNGFDKRPHQINRKGRPKNSDQLKALGMSLLHDPARYLGQIIEKIEDVLN